MRQFKRDWHLFHRVKLQHVLNENLPLDKKFEIFEAMVEEARILGVFPPKSPLEGIEAVLRCAWVLNYGQRAFS